MRDDLQPFREEDDPAGSDRGQRTTAGLDEEQRELDVLLEDLFEERQQRMWLTPWALNEAVKGNTRA